MLVSSGIDLDHGSLWKSPRQVIMIRPYGVNGTDDEVENLWVRKCSIQEYSLVHLLGTAICESRVPERML